MSELIAQSFWTVELRLANEGIVFSKSLLFPNVYSVNGSGALANEYAGAAKKNLLEKGDYLQFMLQQLPATYEKLPCILALPARPGYYPQLRLPFEYVQFELGRKNFLAFVPVAGIEVTGADPQQLALNVIETLKLNFIRHDRYRQVGRIISLQWFENTDLRRIIQRHTVYSQTELDAIQHQDAKSLLAEAATLMRPSDCATFGLEDEIQQLVRSLAGDFPRSVLVKGPPGCGKTVLIEEVAYHAKRYHLQHREFWSTTAARLVQRLTADTGWQKNLGLLCKELGEKNAVLYVKNLAELFEVGQYVGNTVSMGDFLSDYLARGDVLLVSECTPEQAAMLELRAPGYLAHFNPVDLSGEATPAQEKIIQDKIQYIAHARTVTVTEEAQTVLMALIRKFLPYAGLPGKAIRFIEGMIRSKPGGGFITASDVYQQFCYETGMPHAIIDPLAELSLAAIEQKFKARLFGQDHAVDTVTALLARIKSGLSRPGKPIASLLFVGPTGVGKTELAKWIAEYMFGAADKLLRFDMSEFCDPYQILRLTGDMGQEGLLTAKVRQQPFSVVLFDELEKADPGFFDFLLQILGDGRLTDQRGRVTNFTSCIIVMTSNIGADGSKQGSMTFIRNDSKEENKKHYDHAVQAAFRPELFNRLDEIVTFNPLDTHTIRQVLERELAGFKSRPGMEQRPLRLHMDESVFAFLAQTGYHRRYGARFLQRTLTQQFVLPLATAAAALTPAQEASAHIRVENERLVCDLQPALKRSLADLPLTAGEPSLKDLTGLVTRRRRQIVQLMNGPRYHELNSQIDILSGRLHADPAPARRNTGERTNTGGGKLQRAGHSDRKRLNDLQGLAATLRQLCAQMEDFEKNLLRYRFRPTEQPPLRHREIHRWDSHLLEIKLDWYSLLTENADLCTLCLYGNYEVALRVFDLFRESLPLSCLYQVFAVTRYNDAFQDEPCNDTHYYQGQAFGLKIEIRARCIFRMLFHEGGVHVWHSANQTKKLLVEVNNAGAAQCEVPQDAHRAKWGNDFPVRRRYYEQGIEDTRFKLKADGTPAALALRIAWQRELSMSIDTLLRE